MLWLIGLHVEVRYCDLDEQVEDIVEDVELFAAIGIKKHESQACDPTSSS